LTGCFVALFTDIAAWRACSAASVGTALPALAHGYAFTLASCLIADFTRAAAWGAGAFASVRAALPSMAIWIAGALALAGLGIACLTCVRASVRTGAPASVRATALALTNWLAILYTLQPFGMITRIADTNGKTLLDLAGPMSRTIYSLAQRYFFTINESPTIFFYRFVKKEADIVLARCGR
jgi:hypothetical protein